jgi:hypothetical protein
MIYKIVSISFLALLSISSCNKEKRLAKLDGNTKEYANTPIQLEETIYIKVPNTVLPFSASGWGACQSLGIFGNIDYENIIETENPNPYASLARNIRPTAVTMELTSVESCDFSMLDETLEIIVCNHNFTADSTFTFRDPNNLTAYYNAVKLGSYSSQNGSNNAFDTPGSTTLDLVLEEDVLLDQFIAQGLFNIHMKMKVDKAFTDDFAIIKTVMILSAELDNKE